MWIWVRMKSVGDDLLGGREVLIGHYAFFYGHSFVQCGFSYQSLLYSVSYMFSSQGITLNYPHHFTSHSSMHLHNGCQSAAAVCTGKQKSYEYMSCFNINNAITRVLANSSPNAESSFYATALVPVGGRLCACGFHNNAPMLLLWPIRCVRR